MKDTAISQKIRDLRECCCGGGAQRRTGERYPIWLSGSDVSALRTAATQFGGAAAALQSLVPADIAAESLLSYPTQSINQLTAVQGQFTLGHDDIPEIRNQNMQDTVKMGSPDSETFAGVPYQLQNRLRGILQKRRA